jgi:hydrogenase maturation protease
MKTLVIGLGNPLLGDDGVGWIIAQEVQKVLEEANDSIDPGRKNDNRRDTVPIEVDCLAVGGLSLMERFVGYDRGIVIDTIFTGQYAPGTVRCLNLSDLPDLASDHISSVHDASLQTAMRMGRALGAHLPPEITVVTVEARSIYDFTTELTPSVAAAVPEAVQLTLNLLGDRP